MKDDPSADDLLQAMIAVDGWPVDAAIFPLVVDLVHRGLAEVYDIDYEGLGVRSTPAGIAHGLEKGLVVRSTTDSSEYDFPHVAEMLARTRLS